MMVRGMDLASATDMADMADRTTVATTRAFILLIVLCCSVCVEEHGAPFCIGFLWRENEIYQSYERAFTLFLRVIKVNVRWEILLRLVSFGNNARRRIPPVFIPPY